MKEFDKDNTKEAYNLSNYDLVYIILKHKVDQSDVYKDVVKYDKAKERWFLQGKFIEVTGYPLYHTLTFVPEKHLEAFKKAKKFEDKKKYLLNIGFGHIDFIMLPFDNFDWKN